MRMGKCVAGFDFLIVSALFYVIDTEGLFPFVLISAAIHEMGHLLAIKLCGAKVKLFSLGLFGAKIEMEMYPIISYKREIVIALAGPFAGAIFGALLSLTGQYTLAGINLVLTAFNLLPALPLDGGRAIKNLSLIFFDETGQKRINKLGNALSAFFLIYLCAYISLNEGIVPSLLFFTAFTAGSFLKELFD